MIRRLVLALLMLAAVPAEAVTRYSLSRVQTSVANGFQRTAAESPLPSLAVDAGWEESNEVARARMWSPEPTGGSGPVSNGATVSIAEDTGNQEVYIQFVTGPLTAGTAFTSGVTTVSAQIQVIELQSSDDVIACIMGVRVVSNDGLTVRATLLAVADYGNDATEFPTGTYRNETCANSDAVTASYTTVTGDRLEFSLGAQADGAETTPQFGMRTGKGATTDCPADNTTTTTCAAWVEFSNTFTEDTDSILYGVNITSAGNSVDQSSYATASVSPAANALMVLAVLNSHGTAATLPTVTGASMTWTQIATALDASGTFRITMFRAMSASPGSGALTIDFGGTTQTGGTWSLAQFTGAQTTGTNGADAVVQSASNTAASGSSLTVTLGSAFGSASNLAYAAIFHAASETNTTPIEQVGLGESSQANPNRSLGHLTSLNDTTSTMSWVTSSINLGMAIEVKQNVAAAAAFLPRPPFFGRHIE